MSLLNNYTAGNPAIAALAKSYAETYGKNGLGRSGKDIQAESVKYLNSVAPKYEAYTPPSTLLNGLIYVDSQPNSLMEAMFGTTMSRDPNYTYINTADGGAVGVPKSSFGTTTTTNQGGSK